MKAESLVLSVDVDSSQIDYMLSTAERLVQVLQEAKSLVDDLTSCKIDVKIGANCQPKEG